jgi:hypothetical protein
MLKLAAASIALLFLAAPALTLQAEGEVDQASAEQLALQKQWGRFAPNGWRILQASTGSFFAEKSKDALLVIEEEDPAKISKNDGLGNPDLNTNPRVLLLLSGQGIDYAVKGRFEGFLPSEGDPEAPCLADPLMEGKGARIEKRTVSIGLHYWYSCGTWYVNSNDYKFRLEKGRLRLIDIESWSFHRAGGMGTQTSVNYLTGRKKHIDNVSDFGPQPELAEGEEMPKPVTKWTRVNRGPYYLDQMKRVECAEYQKAPNWCGY